MRCDEFAKATRRARELQASFPRVVNARYDRATRRVVLSLSSNVDLSFSPKDAQCLENARPSHLERVEITPSGLGIHFPKLDADLYLPGLLEGMLGSRKWMASRLGRVGGRSTSTVKKAASRANGKLGGRPKKSRPA